MYEIRDPVHRTIEFTEREKMAIDHPFVQRLRFIRQLGMTFLVYPGAGHDRFSHSVGAMHVSGLAWKRIGETSGKIMKKYFSHSELDYLYEVLRFAALLHDIGHPPFSHVSEKFMPRLGQLSLPTEWFLNFDAKRRAKHEDYSALLIANMAVGEKPILSASEAQDICSLVHHDCLPSSKWRETFGRSGGRGGIHSLLRSLISGELDCDRMDYLLRDAHHTGATYGHYDMEHLISNLGVTLDKNNDLVLTLDASAVRAFEDFLLARYHMFLQVYLHKTTLVFDHFLEQAIISGELNVNIPGEARDYVKLRDSTVIERLFAAAEAPQNQWSRRFIRRKPAKLAISASRPAGKRILRFIEKEFSKKKISFFTVKAKQFLSKATSHVGEGSHLLVRRKLFGNFLFEPIEQYSPLLQKYSEVIDLNNLYVLPSDWAKAKKILNKIKILKPSSI